MISRAASSACTAWKSGTRKTTEPPRRSGSRGDVELEPGLVDEVDEQRRLPHRVLADPLDADLGDDLVAGARRVVRRDDRRARQEARRAGRRLHLGLERERPRVPLPARERRLELLGEVGPHVEPAGARPAAQPLDRAADAELDAERRHVERHRARRLVRVEADVRAGLVRALDDALDRLDLRGLVEHVRDRHEQRALVDRVDHRVGVLADDDLGAEARPRLLHVAHRREEPLLEDDAVARRLQVEAREDDRLGDRHVLVHDGRAGRRADDPADQVADAEHRVPPAFAPGARAARRPLARELLQPALGLRRHRAERVVDQVRRRLEDREAIAVVGQLHGAKYLQRARARCRSCARPTRGRRRGSTTIGPGAAVHRRHDLHRRRDRRPTIAFASMHGTHSSPPTIADPSGLRGTCARPSTFSVRASTRVTTFVSCETYSEPP